MRQPVVDWIADAACTGLPTELFFFEKGEGAGNEQKKILEICNGQCPVREQCLEEAMALEESFPSIRYGIWGGLTPNGRKKEWRRRNGIADQSPSDDRVCIRGHVLGEANAYIRQDGFVACKTCRREARKAKRHALRASA